jgi:hypothetical protein
LAKEIFKRFFLKQETLNFYYKKKIMGLKFCMELDISDLEQSSSLIIIKNKLKVGNSVKTFGTASGPIGPPLFHFYSILWYCLTLKFLKSISDQTRVSNRSFVKKYYPNFILIPERTAKNMLKSKISEFRAYY